MKTASDIHPQFVRIIEMSLNNMFKIAHNMVLCNALVMLLKKWD